MESVQAVSPPSQVQAPALPLPRSVASGMLLPVFEHQFPSPGKETDVCGVPDPRERFCSYCLNVSIPSNMSFVFYFILLTSFIEKYFTYNKIC